MDSTADSPPARQRPPAGVLVLTAVLLLTALGGFLVGAEVLWNGPAPWSSVPLLGEADDLVAFSPLPLAVDATIGIIAGLIVLVVAVGFVRLTPWGWTGLMLLAAMTLTVNLVAVVLGRPDEASMAVAIVAVLYANQRRIQVLFRGEPVIAFEPVRSSDVRPHG